MSDSSSGSERPFYVYILVLGNLIGVAGMAFLLLGVLGALGLITAVTDSLGGFGSSFASASAGSAAKFSFAFLASLISLSASWKMFREGPKQWLLGLVIVFQLAAAGVFHSWVSVIVLIPALAALYGLGRTIHGPAAGVERRPVMAEERSPSWPAASPAGAVAAPVAATASRAAATAEPKIRQESEGDPSPATVALPSRRCANCGAMNTDAARFCSACGSILPGSS